MAKLIVKGGRFLEGEITVGGSKNATLPAIAASLLFEKDPEIKGAPRIEDVSRMTELLSLLKKTGEIDVSVAKKIRASILLVGPALARFGEAIFPHPGGCVIGSRPIDVFLDGWKAMGAKAGSAPPGKNSSLEFYQVKAGAGGLHGAEFTFRVPSVTGTEGLMMTAVLAKGRTILKNAALEPEVAALADFLNQNGAEISGAGTPTITIEGRCGKLLEPKKAFLVPPDRIEAGSFMILGALLAKKLLIKNFAAEELNALTASLKSAGAEFEINSEKKFAIIARSADLKATSVKTKEYPGFPTDLQAPFAVLATQARGASMIHETIFEGRLNYAEDLNKMGASVLLCDPHRAIINGPAKLKGRTLESPDIRAGLAFIIAALVAEGESQIGNVYQIDRGYEKIDARLRALGADIKRI